MKRRKEKKMAKKFNDPKMCGAWRCDEFSCGIIAIPIMIAIIIYAMCARPDKNV